MTILVTGASGFVGSAIVRHLLSQEHNVRVLLRAESPPDNLAGLDVQRVIGDLTDTASLKAATKGCSSLIHSAADYRLWAADPEPMYAANVRGTENIMRAALDADIERIVYTSSVATLGLCTDGIAAVESRPSS
ncbi:MAG: NAD-dependent epimerase/dehydratase family protein, partial [Mariprofundaceae bacterium]|nr:NAD-dependent epimerase/dehydratase family protein [Mariprofundaceae bacterium]